MVAVELQFRAKVEIAEAKPVLALTLFRPERTFASEPRRRKFPSETPRGRSRSRNGGRKGKEGRKEGRKEGTKGGREEGRKEGREGGRKIKKEGAGAVVALTCFRIVLGDTNYFNQQRLMTLTFHQCFEIIQ